MTVARAQAAAFASAKASADTALLDSSAAIAPRQGDAEGATTAAHWAPLVAADSDMGASAGGAGIESPVGAVLASRRPTVVDDDSRVVMLDIECLAFEQAEFEQVESRLRLSATFFWQMRQMT